MTPLELLAPARDAEIAIMAIMHGADAVYMGGPSHGARAAAGNTIDDVARVAAFAHKYGARLYVTLNTIIFENELQAVSELVKSYRRAGVDALIVQDMALLRLDTPPIALHASTQCDIRTPQKARFLAECGFTQLVLPRELTLDEIRLMRAAVPQSVRLEAFVHGALCVSYSGDCQASCAANGRSANRGECAQMCRMAYNLEDGNGNVIIKGKHLLSLSDLNRLADVEAMAQAGISSFKIEGRLKDASYVKTVVSAYRQALDRVIASHPGEYCRSSFGTSRISFTPDVSKVFNRGFIPYFLHSERPSGRMAVFDSPKPVGVEVGKVIKSRGRVIEAALTATLSNGDGIGYFDAAGCYAGFRLNKIDGNRLYAAGDVNLRPGTVLYRNRDAAFEAALGKETAARTIGVTLRLDKCAGGISLRATTPHGHMAQARIDCIVSASRTSQHEPRGRVLAKLGDTIFHADEIIDNIPDSEFVQASVLSDIRRRACALLETSIVTTHPYERRGIENLEALCPITRLTYHENVANSLSARFYADHGAEISEQAFECNADKKAPGRVVMTTRYCLRREMGACLKENGSRRLPNQLYLSNRATRYRLQFDCKNCRMHLLTT